MKFEVYENLDCIEPIKVVEITTLEDLIAFQKSLGGDAVVKYEWLHINFFDYEGEPYKTPQIYLDVRDY